LHLAALVDPNGFDTPRRILAAGKTKPAQGVE